MSRTMVRGGPRARIRGAVWLMLVLVLGSVSLVGCSSGPKPSPTIRVERGSVATKVTGSGALVAVTSQSLGFAKGGQLTEVDVKVGDQVRPGQVLARIDPFPFQQALNQQQALLAQQQALLDKAVRDTTVSGAQATLAQAKKILSATKDNVEAQDRANETAIDRAQVQLNFDQQQVDQARRQAARACRGGFGSFSAGSSSQPGSRIAPTDPSTTEPSEPGDPAEADLPTGSRQRRGWRASAGSPWADLTGTGQPGVSPGTTGSNSSTGSTGMTDSVSTSCASAQQAVSTAERQVIADQTALDTAKRTRDVDRTSGQVAIENARQGVVTAQNSLDAGNAARNPDIDAQAALVANQRAAVALAQRDVDNTVLRAPVAGTVSALNGNVGEWVGPTDNNTSTALAPGSTAPIPGVGAAGTSAMSSANNTLSATRPGGSAFIVLNNINTFQVVVPFEESDAVRVAPNQNVEVTFDAIPGLTRHGTVLSVAPGGVNISGVTNYYATILLTETDPRLKDGLTAETDVLVNELTGVLVVPNAAVQHQGNQTFVNTPGPDGKPVRVPFQAGQVGDDNTQVLSGLNEGQVILLPSVTPPSTARKAG